MPKVIINGKTLDCEAGQTVLDVARSRSISIPTLCYLEGCGPSDRCGVCLVQIRGMRELAHACSTEAKEGMEILTDSPKVRAARQERLKELISSGQHNCFVSNLPPAQWNQFQLAVMQSSWHQGICPAHGDCRLQDLAVEYGVSIWDAMPAGGVDYPLDDEHPMIVRDYSRCISCGRCELACNQVQGNNAIALPPVSEESKQAYPEVDYDNCTHCGECLQACPVGALFEKKAHGLALGANSSEKVRTTCPYCGVGCQLWLHVKDDRVVRVTGVEGAQPNRGRLCVKGRFGYDFIHSDERLTTPLIKENGEFRRASWDEALDLVATKFKQIIAESGPDAIAGVSCARSINEDSYNMQKLFRAVIGTNNIDHCART